jgi:zinc transport system substrate-binding protein
MKKVVFLIFILIFSVLTFGCQTENDDNVRVKVAVSILPQEAFVKSVGKDYVSVLTVIPPGYSPANYEPSAKTMADLSKVDVYFTIGVPTEAGNVLPDIEDLNKVRLEEEVRNIYPDREFAPGNRDPHIWLSIKRVKVMVQIIADELSRLDPEKSEFYQDNASDYLEELETTHLEILELFTGKTMRKFMLFHPSFGYFADDYNLEMYALELDGKEATIKHLQDMIDLAKANEIQTVFHQAEIDSEQVRSFIEEIDAELVQLNPLSSDYINNILLIATKIGDSLS